MSTHGAHFWYRQADFSVKVTRDNDDLVTVSLGEFGRRRPAGRRGRHLLATVPVDCRRIASTCHTRGVACLAVSVTGPLASAGAVAGPKARPDRVLKAGGNRA